MNVRARLDQVRTDIADLPDDANSAALRGLADLIELMLVEPDRQIDAREHDPTTELAVASAKLSRAGVKEYPVVRVHDTHDKRVWTTIELLAENGYKSFSYNEDAQRVALVCGAKLTFFTSGKAIVQGKVDAHARSEIVGLLRVGGWAVK